MRFCNNCKRITTGEPLYCNFCGSSYDVKLCHSRHPNPRNAEVCSECGSREFSRPAPALAPWTWALLVMLRYAPAAVLIIVSLSVLAATVQAVLTDARVQSALVCLIFVLAITWWLYINIASFTKGLFKRLWPFSTKKKSKSTHSH